MKGFRIGNYLVTMFFIFYLTIGLMIKLDTFLVGYILLGIVMFVSTYLYVKSSAKKTYKSEEYRFKIKVILGPVILSIILLITMIYYANRSFNDFLNSTDFKFFERVRVYDGKYIDFENNELRDFNKDVEQKRNELISECIISSIICLISSKIAVILVLRKKQVLLVEDLEIDNEFEEGLLKDELNDANVSQSYEKDQ